MPLLTTPIGIGAIGTIVADLHSELAVVSGPVDANEVANSFFGKTTQKAVREFQERYNLERTGTVDQATGALMTATATYAIEGNSQTMRDNLGQAVNANPNVAPLAYELTRYEILAGEYGEARNIFNNLLVDDVSQPDMNDTVGRILADPNGQVRFTPEVPYPGNFYTYRNNYLDQEDINRMLRDLRNLNPVDISIPINTNEPPESIRDRTIKAAQAVLMAIDHWQQGIRLFDRQQYQLAILEFNACQQQVLRYFTQFYQISVGTGSRNRKLIQLIRHLKANGWTWLWTVFNWRRSLLSLEQLRRVDWEKPPLIFKTGKDFIDSLLQVEGESQPDPLMQQARELRVDVPLVTLAFIFAPLARGEAEQMRRHFEGAIDRFQWFLSPIRADDDPDSQQIHLACEFIEIPFASLRLGQVFMARAEARYKARRLRQARNSYRKVIDLFEISGNYKTDVESALTSMNAEVSALLAKSFHPLVINNPGVSALTKTERTQFALFGKGIPIATIASNTRAMPGLDRRSGPHESLLKFTDQNGTTNPLIFALVTEARARLLQIENGFNYLGYSDEHIPPWRFQYLLERARYFAEHAKNAQREYLNFLSNAEREELQELTASQTVELEKSNIRIETGRVEQTRLEVEVAKRSQELADLQKENADTRLGEFRDFDDLADDLTETGIQGSLITRGLREFSDLREKTGGLTDIFISPPGLGSLGIDFKTGGAASKFIQIELESARREYEKLNLRLAAQEARKSSELAGAQVEVAEAGLVIAALQRSAALLRHEFAVQSLNFLRNRTLNAELWYRLSAMIRAVADTYMRYAVELAFLAEQAYEFEADKRINVIRFDYDVSEEGSLLAADFLLRDLDTLEQDLIVNQRQRQQQVRYVLSLAREFPEALQDLRDNNSTIFNLRLEHLERRFPGLFNIRIGAVDVTPVAMMDPTRFSLELTYLGSSQVRLKVQPDTPVGVQPVSPLNINDLETFLFQLSLNQFPQFPTELDMDALSAELRDEFDQQGHQLSPNATVTQVSSGIQWRVEDGQNKVAYSIRRQGNKLLIYRLDVGDDWLQELAGDWPVKIRVLGPETAIFSGLNRQDVSAVFPFASTAQRGAFENLGAAAGWRIDMSMKENQVVPGTVADILITFTLSGYYDPDLRFAVDNARRRPQALTQFLSARQRFADAFYEFNRSGRMVWEVTESKLSLDEPVRNLRNLGIILLPGPNQSQFSSLMSTYTVELDVTAGGQFEIMTPIPEITFSIDRLEVTASVDVDDVAGANISWDFGEDDGFQNANNHIYNRPGKYAVGLRLVKDSRLYEYKAEIFVSRTQTLPVPLTAHPSFEDAPQGQPGIQARTNAPANENVTVIWRVDQNQPEQSSDTLLNLPPGKHLVRFIALRNLQARIYSQQRFVPDQLLDVESLRLSTNRVFELDGIETTGIAPNDVANALTEHIFPEDLQTNERLPLSPVDRWTVELLVDDNPFLRSVTPSDSPQVYLGGIEDAILILEYEAGSI